MSGTAFGVFSNSLNLTLMHMKIDYSLAHAILIFDYKIGADGPGAQ